MLFIAINLSKFEGKLVNATAPPAAMNPAGLPDWRQPPDGYEVLENDSISQEFLAPKINLSKNNFEKLAISNAVW